MTDLQALRVKIKKSKPPAIILDLSGIFTAIQQEKTQEESDGVACGICLLLTEEDDGLNNTPVATPDVPILEAILIHMSYIVESRELETVIFRLH